MKIKQFVLSEFGVNCYLLIENNEAILIDVSFNPDSIEQYINENNIKLRAILLTHAHLDHIAGIDQIRGKFGAPVYIHKNEEKWLTDPSLNGSRIITFYGEIKCQPADYLIDGEDILNIDGFEVKVIHTPGHSPGGTSYYINDLLFTGDTLFYSSVGRTDLYGGDSKQLVKSIQEKLFLLPDDTKVFPGHGEKTTIDYEKKNNPYL